MIREDLELRNAGQRTEPIDRRWFRQLLFPLCSAVVFIASADVRYESVYAVSGQTQTEAIFIIIIARRISIVIANPFRGVAISTIFYAAQS